MLAYKEFKRLLEYNKASVKENEYLRVEICGIEANCLQFKQDSKSGEAVLVIQGQDSNGNEVVMVSPAGHFIASITIVPRTDSRKTIGFKISDESSN